MKQFIISECRTLAQKKYKTRHDWVGKVIHWELRKRLKFAHTNKLYKHKLDSILKNEKQKILRDFEILMKYLILTSRPDPDLINKKKELAI